MEKKRKLIKKIVIGLLCGALGVMVLPLILGMMFIWDSERYFHEMARPGREALAQTGMGDLGVSPGHVVVTADGLTAFEVSVYDDHVNNTRQRDVMQEAAKSAAGWHAETLTWAEFARHQAKLAPETAFLQPDTGFTAWYADETSFAAFDAESGLFMLLTGAAGKARDFAEAGLRITRIEGMYSFDSHGGFFDNGVSWQAFVVPQEQRGAAEAAMTSGGSWREGEITRAEYVRMHQAFPGWLPGLYPAKDVVFDLWYWEDAFAAMHPERAQETGGSLEQYPRVMQDAGVVRSRNWRVAVYDRESGLLIWYAYDS